MGVISYDDYIKNKKKKKESNNIQLSNNGVIQIGDLEKLNGSKLEFAPDEGKSKSGLFQSSKYFDDGYQFGDVTKTIGASTGDLASDIGKGFMNTMEGVAD